MREILFRGKRQSNGEWVEGFLVKMWGAIHLQNKENENLMVQVDPETLGECTGLRDRNGVKIFEGDIVNYDNGLVSEIYEVVYIEKYARFAFIKPNTVFAVLNAQKCEVVGNVHDDPKLLEVKP